MKHELLLPVGNMEMAQAAVHHGADAIYMGVPGFNARGRSMDFSLEQMRSIIDFAHLHGVRAHLAWNVVIFEEELSACEDLFTQILQLHPDAIIVQDLGLARRLRQLAPEQILHASTQMTVTNEYAIQALKELNIRRYVLGRENSLKDIQWIRQKTSEELEVFVHGALCVSYSGQCFTSESLGGRSANRGQCAQSCRFEYEMFVDGQKTNLGAKKYLVSPQDLCGLRQIPQLMSSGVQSFKVEGRLKAPAYVAAAARAYRYVIDQTLLGNVLQEKKFQDLENKMATTYSRGFYPGWLNGVAHQELVNGTYGSHRGLACGSVIGWQGKYLKVKLTVDSLKPGDGLMFVDPSGRMEDTGTFIFESQKKDSFWLLGFQAQFAQDKIVPGMQIYWNHDAGLKKELQQGMDDRRLQKKVPAIWKINAQLGQPLTLQLEVLHAQVQGSTASALQVARTQGLTEESVKAELSSLGGTSFQFDQLQALGDQNLAQMFSQPMFLSHRELKELRQKLVAEAQSLILGKNLEGTVVKSSSSDLSLKEDMPVSTMNSDSRSSTEFHLLLRNKDQVQTLLSDASLVQSLLQEIPTTVFLDFEFGRDEEPSLKSLQQAGFNAGMATTRILKPEEDRHLKRILKMQPDAILIRNLGAFQFFQNEKYPGKLHADFSLNVSNHWTANELLKMGFDSLTCSYDLNAQQVADLIQATSAKKMVVTLHQYMPSFHMEHCVFAAFLSQGNSFRDCGKPCEKHSLELKDQFGNRHFIKADQECRNTMYHAKAQTALLHAEAWKNQGLGAFRFEALNEQGSSLLEKIQTYVEFFRNPAAAASLISILGASEKYGLGSGTMEHAHRYKSRKNDGTNGRVFKD